MALPAVAPAVGAPAARPRRPVPRWVDPALAVLLAAGVFVVHDVGTGLRRPFWLDESWVVSSTRAPLAKLPLVTGPTPLGWTFLLRAMGPFAFAGEQRYRLFPLLFAAAAVAVAYYLGRELGLVPVVAGALTGGAVLLVPGMLARNDLKQYTAEAFVALASLLAVARLESAWSRRRLAWVAGLAAGGMLLAHAAALVGPACLLGLGVQEAIYRRWTRLRDVAVAAAAAGAGQALVYLTADAPHRTASLREYWRPFYLNAAGRAAGAPGRGSLPRVVADRIHTAAPMIGLGPTTAAVALVAVGLVTLAVRGHLATALVLPVVAAGMFVAALAGDYPFLDLRTSTFLFAMAAAVAAVGLAGLVALAAGQTRLGAVVVAGLAAAWLVYGATPWIRRDTLPHEDVRSQVRYVAAHRASGDAVVVTLGADWSAVYYGLADGPWFHASPVSNGFVPAYPTTTGVVLAEDRTMPAVATAVGRAARLSSTGRVWVVRAHVTTTERRFLRQALHGYRQLSPVGRVPVFLRPGTATARVPRGQRAAVTCAAPGRAGARCRG